MKHRLSICGFLLLAGAAAGAQVASHAPTVFTKPPAAQAPVARPSAGPATVALAATGKPVVRVNGSVLTDTDLVREEYTIFPYARQHNGLPKDLEPQIRAGALQMIVFEELVYQEALRRKMTVSAVKVQRAEADFRAQFATPEEFNALLAGEFHGSRQLLLQKIRRSLMIDAFLQGEVEDKAAVSPAEVRAYYDQEHGTLRTSGVVYLPVDLQETSSLRPTPLPASCKRGRGAGRSSAASSKSDPRQSRNSDCWRRRSRKTITA